MQNQIIILLYIILILLYSYIGFTSKDRLTKFLNYLVALIWFINFLIEFNYVVFHKV